MIAKYITSNLPNILPIDYNDFHETPVETFHKIITFFGLKYTKQQISEFITNRDEKISKRYMMTNETINKLKTIIKSTDTATIHTFAF